MDKWLLKLLLPLLAGFTIGGGGIFWRFYDLGVSQARLEERVKRAEEDVRLLMNHVATDVPAVSNTHAD